MLPLTATLLSACVTSSQPTSVNLVAAPSIPADVKACFDKLVPAPKQATMTQKQVLILIAKLRKSELEKANCGHRVISMWQDYQDSYGSNEGR
jgi:hypothetical protein